MISTLTIRLEVYAGFLLFDVPLVAVLLYHSDGTSMGLSSSCSPLSVFRHGPSTEGQPLSWPDFICILESWLMPPLSITPCSPLCPLHHQ